MMHDKNETKSFQRRLRLVFCLVPILCIWSLFVFAVPIPDSSNGTRNVVTQRQNQTVKLRARSGASDWEQVTILDPISGRIQIEEREVLERKQGQLPLFIKQFVRDGTTFNRWQLNAVELEQAQVTPRREFDFPSLVCPQIVDHRFAVLVEPNAIVVLDIDATEPKAIGYPSIHVKSQYVTNIRNSKRFVLATPIPAQSTSDPKLVAIELFDIDDSGGLNLVNTWNALSGMSSSLTEFDGRFVSIHPDGRFEIRSTVDGSLIETKPLPQDLHVATSNWNLTFMETLWTGKRIYSLRTNRWIKVPKDCFHSFNQDSPAHALRLWTGNDESERVVTECDSDKVVCKFRTPYSDSVGSFLDEETLVFVSSQWGCAWQTVDARTGKTIKAWRPYWWVLPALLFSFPTYLIWSIAWLRSAQKASGWIWADIAWTSSFPILALTLRVALVCDSLDFTRYPYYLLFGLFTALIFLACAWVCNSTTWIVRKLIPLLLVLDLVSFLLSFAIASKNSGATSLFLAAVLISATSLVACVAQRSVGFRIHRLTHAFDSKKSSLRELFILVFVSATLFTTLRLIIPDPTSVDVSRMNWLPLASVVVMPLLAWSTSLAENRFFHGFGKWLSLALFAFLMLDILNHFITGDWQFRISRTWDELLVSASMAFVSTFVLSKAFRHRGWRIRWTRPPLQATL